MEPTLTVGDVFEAASDTALKPGSYRLLEIERRTDMATIIAIPTTRRQSGAKQKNYYATGFERIRFSSLESWFVMGLLKHIEIALPHYWFMDDAEICAILDPAATRASANLPALLSRDKKWKLIEPLVPIPLGRGKKPPNLTYLDAQVKAQAQATGVSAGQLYDALHRYFAYGSIRNALLPNRIGRCGNPGLPRLGKSGKKLGRKNAAAKLGDIEHAGLVLTDKDIQNIQDAYQLIKPGVSVREAYGRMNAMFYSSGNVMRHGYLTPQLLPAHQRPTIANFVYHGPRGNDKLGAARRLMGEGEWLKNLRPLLGTARDGISVIGQTGSIDASPIDVYLVSCCNPNQSIGVGRAVFVRDVYSGLFLGWTLAIGNPTAQDAKLAILRAAENKSIQLKKYGLDLPVDDFPCLFFAKYHADNGELRCKDALLSITNELRGGIEFIPSHRPDLNSTSETGHQIRHKSLDFRLPGTTRGRQTKRGETPPISKALLSRYSYMQLLFNWVHWYNCKKPLGLKDIPAEMQRDYSASGLPLPRTRLGLFRWAVDNGYVAGRSLALNHLRAHLLPRFTATLRRDGIILHRPGLSGAVELLHGAKFNDPYLAESGLMRAAVHRKATHIEVRADPDDLSSVFIIDQYGVHQVPNVMNDALLIHEGSIGDLCGMNDEQKVLNVLAAHQTDQDECDLATFRHETIGAEKARKRASQRVDKEAGAKAKQAGVREAQANEKSRLLDDSFKQSGPQDIRQPALATSTPSSLNSLEQRRMQRLMEFLASKKEEQ